MDGDIFFGTAGDTLGFGAAGDDCLERGIDLNEQLASNKPATFFTRMRGDAMEGAGIYHGDLVIIDRSLKAASGRIVIALLNGEVMIRRLEKTFNKLRLHSESPKASSIEIDLSSSEFSIWGVVTYAVHQVV